MDHDLEALAEIDYWLFAYGNSRHAIVLQSVAVPDLHPSLEPVTAHVREHGLVLVDMKKYRDTKMMFGECICSWYSTPQERNAVLAGLGSGSLIDSLRG